MLKRPSAEVPYVWAFASLHRVIERPGVPSGVSVRVQIFPPPISGRSRRGGRAKARESKVRNSDLGLLLLLLLFAGETLHAQAKLPITRNHGFSRSEWQRLQEF